MPSKPAQFPLRLHLLAWLPTLLIAARRGTPLLKTSTCTVILISNPPSSDTHYCRSRPPRPALGQRGPRRPRQFVHERPTAHTTRVLAVWAVDCAERALALFEAHAPGDTRPRDAIDGLRAFARSELRIGSLRALAAQAHAAAREVSDPAAVTAARAAGHAAAVAHMAAHARGAPAYAAVARRLGASDDPAAVADEVHWAVSHASPTVREVLRRLPPPTRHAGLLGRSSVTLHTQLTRDE